MVQYIPSPAGSEPYPNAGKGNLDYQILGNLGSDVGNTIGGILRGHQEAQVKAQQDAFLKQTIGDMMKKMQPQPAEGPINQTTTQTPDPRFGPVGARAAGSGFPGRPGGQGIPGYAPPHQGPNSTAVPTGQQPTMKQTTPGQQPMTSGPTLTMHDFAMINKYSPQLAARMAQTLFPSPQKTVSKLPPETVYLDPKTGEPSLTPKNGYVPQAAPPGTGVRLLTQWHYRKILEGDKDARLHLSKSIQDNRVADQINKQMEPVDNAIETYNSLLKMRSKMSKESMNRVQDIVKNPNPNFIVSMYRHGRYQDATDYYNQLMAAKNSLKGIASNKISGGKELNDLASILPDGTEDAQGLKNKQMAFKRAADTIRARTIALARAKEAAMGTNDPAFAANQMLGLPSVGDIDMGESTDFSSVDQDLGQ